MSLVYPHPKFVFTRNSLSISGYNRISTFFKTRFSYLSTCLVRENPYLCPTINLNRIFLEMNDKERIDTQRLFFGKRKPLSLKYRLQSLKRLQKTIRQYESDIEKALENDLHKSVYESYTTEIGFVLSELRRTIKHLKQWAAPRRTRTPLFLFGSTSRIEFQAYGNVLILAPWNYPFQLVFTPLIGAVAAGNCVTVKCSPYAIRTSEICRKIIDEAFDRRHV